MKNYECRICGCTLDPGEGTLCDECREKKEQEKSPIDTGISKGQVESVMLPTKPTI